MSTTARAMVAAAAVLTAGSAAPLYASEALNAVVSAYLEVHAQLAADKIDTVPAAAEKIATHAAQLPSDGTAVVNAARALERVKDLTTARDRFSALTDAVIAAARAEGWKDLSGVKLGYCPMLKRSWLQKEKDVRNPYGMLTCGVLKEKS